MANSDFDQTQAERFARLALACVHQEYPNKIAHSLTSDADVKPPRQLTPAFYGCFDWHSDVHGHWLLVRLVRFGETALGWLPTQIDYADYRDTNGVKIPYRWTVARPSGRFTIHVSDVRQNVALDDAKFAKPAAEQQKGPAK